MKEYIILFIPFVGTAMGAAMVFFLRQEINARIEKLLLGFAAGVMIAASVWSLLIPAIEMAGEQDGGMPWFPAAAGFLLSVGVFLLLDMFVPQIHLVGEKPGDAKDHMKKTMMMVLAVTTHNLPEGMAVGVIFAGAMMGTAGITMVGVLAVTIGIAIQNFPEGAIVSMPLRAAGFSRRKAFLYGVLSGVVEPVGTVLTILLAAHVVPVLPYLLAFAAGAMIYVVVEEIIPESQAGKYAAVSMVGVAAGFVLMMILDVALG